MVNYLEEPNLLMKGVSKTAKNEARKKKVVEFVLCY